MKKVFEFIEKYHMITEGDMVIAGISGGADSVCLFFVLLELRRKSGIDFIAVHVNHGLRGEPADADEAFVRTLCSKYKVPLEVSRVHLELIAKNRKQSLEEAGRMVRREAFEAAGGKRTKIRSALAHHQNDNAETFLWNLSRGSGLDGMGGIRPVNGKYIRPLLCLCRKDIEQFLKEKGQDFCTDATNAETAYTRNKLRHLVIPILEQEVNAGTIRHFNEAMEQIREVQEYMEAQAAAAFEQCVFRKNSRQGEWEAASWMTEREPDDGKREEKGCYLVRRKQWENYPLVLQKMLLRRVLELLAGQMRDVGRVHIQALLDLFEKQVGKRVDLPFSVQAIRVYEGIELSRSRQGMAEERLSDSARMLGGAERSAVSHYEREKEKVNKLLRIPGETEILPLRLKIRCSVFLKPASFSRKEIPEKIYTKWFDYDIIKTILCIRTRESGDFLTVDRAGHRQKLKSWFINNKIPAKERDGCLCIAEGKEILWILGYRMNSAYQVQEHTKRILQIEVMWEEGQDGSGFAFSEEAGTLIDGNEKRKCTDSGCTDGTEERRKEDGGDDSGAGIGTGSRSENRGAGQKD